MSTISLPGQTKVSTLQERFKGEFGLTLRVYDGRNFAEPDATIGQVRKKTGATSIDIRRNTKVGNLEARFMEDFGIKVQIAGSDDSYLCDNDLTLAAALEKDEQKLGRKTTRAAAGEAQKSQNSIEENHTDILQALNKDDAIALVKQGIVDKVMERGTAVRLIGGDPTIRILFDEVDPYEDGETAIWGIVELEHEMNEEGPASIDDDDAEGLCDWVWSVFDDASDDFSEEISSALEEISFVVLYKGDYYG